KAVSVPPALPLPHGGFGGSDSSSSACAAACVSVAFIDEFHRGGVTPSRCWTKKSQRLWSPYGPPDVWFAPGIARRSKFLSCLISWFTTCSVEEGSTLVSISP